MGRSLSKATFFPPKKRSLLPYGVYAQQAQDLISGGDLAFGFLEMFSSAQSNAYTGAQASYVALSAVTVLALVGVLF